MFGLYQCVFSLYQYDEAFVDDACKPEVNMNSVQALAHSLVTTGEKDSLTCVKAQLKNLVSV